MATFDDKGKLLTWTKEEEEQMEVYGIYPEPPAKKGQGVPSALKYPIGHEPPPPEDDPVEDTPHPISGHNKELLPTNDTPPISRTSPTSLVRLHHMFTETTIGDLKNLSETLSQEAKKSISQSAIIRALVHLAAHDPALIPKILSYVVHEEIKPGRK